MGRNDVNNKDNELALAVAPDIHEKFITPKSAR